VRRPLRILDGVPQPAAASGRNIPQSRLMC
jgi:hypothetical protein